MLETTVLSLLLLASAPSDDRAVKIAEEVLEALGGKEAWEDARFIRFTFVRRGRPLDIAWDRYTGSYRLDATNEAGVPFTAIMNLRTRQGTVWLEGRPLADKELSEYLSRAERIWAGEIYWLLMPYKLLDPGVILSYEGEEQVGGALYDELHLRFENVGLTPGDEFWAYINRRSRLMDRWKFRLQGGYEGDYRWAGWERFGGILLATERVSAGEDGEVILFENIVVSDSVPEGVFDAPGPIVTPPVPRPRGAR